MPSLSVVRRAPLADGEGAKPSLVENAYRALKEAIRTNRLLPGAQASEQELADQLGVSRTPVHEAVIRLQEEGLVEVLTRRGVRICSLSHADIREIYEVVSALEAMAAELLATQSPEQRETTLRGLEHETTEMELALVAGDLDRWAEADERYHNLLIHGCGNGRIARIAGTVRDQLHRTRMLTLRMRPNPQGSAVEHRAVIQAIRAGDITSAHALARAHRVRSRDELLPLLLQAGMTHT